MTSKPTTQEKLKIVYEYNTYFNKIGDFEDKYQSYIEQLVDNVCEFQKKVKKFGFTKELLEELLLTDDGLNCALIITGFSLEFLCGVVMWMRVMDMGEFETLFYKSKWDTDPLEKDWSPNKIKKLIKNNYYFRKFIVNLFTEGVNSSSIKKYLPRFEYEKLDAKKFQDIVSVPKSFIDTQVRTREKGSYAASKENNCEVLIENILKELNIPFTRGDLPLLTKNNSSRKRTMDFIIPNKDNPISIMESSFVQTTASGMGDKAKAEIQVGGIIRKDYPNAHFDGFIDGVGWLRRPKDLLRMCEAYDDVYTYHPIQLERYKRKVYARMNQEGN